MDTLDHILVVDDDVEICQLLSQYLNKNGYKTSVAHEGRAMWHALDTTHIDLIVLDLMLPGDDGLTLCRNLRAQSNIPVIMLTALGEETDRIVGLEMGADDYLPKPFSARELLARIKGVLRRTRTLPPSSRLNKAQAPTKWRFGPWLLDGGQRHLIDDQGVMTALSSTEYRLLLVFLHHPEHVLSRDQLMDLTQGRDANPLDRIIDVQISRLRARLLDDPKEPTLIKTIRNEGYVLAVPVERVP